MKDDDLAPELVVTVRLIELCRLRAAGAVADARSQSRTGVAATLFRTAAPVIR
jgi:hypothetical protein